MRSDLPYPLDYSGLAAFWPLDEPAGHHRYPRGGGPALTEGAGPIATRPGGVFGERIMAVDHGRWLEAPRESLGALDIHGPEAEFTLVAWFRRDHPERWQAIAGVWDESRDKRQYCLFAHARLRPVGPTLERVPTEDRIHGHVSNVGGPTPGRDFCHTYATNGTPIPVGEWVCATVTYTGGTVTLYRDGVLDAEPGSNPLPAPGGIFDGGRDGASFSVGANSVRGAMGNFFGGLIGGLAVYRRALTATEIRELALPINRLRELHPAPRTGLT